MRRISGAAAGSGQELPLVDEPVQRVGDDVVAARREVDGLLEEQVGPGQRGAQRRQQVEARERQRRQRRVEPSRRRVAHQLAAGRRRPPPSDARSRASSTWKRAGISAIAVPRAEPPPPSRRSRGCTRG